MHTWGMMRVKWGQLSWNLSTAMVLKNTILELHLHRFYLPHDSFVFSVPEINIRLTLCVFAYHLLPHRKLRIVILLGKLEVPTLMDVKEFSNTLLQKERKIVPPPPLKMWTRNLWFWNYVVCEQIAIGTNDVYKTSAAAQQAGAKIVREAGPLPGLDTKIVSCLDPDGWKTVSKLFGQYFKCRLIDSHRLQNVSQPWHFPF